MVTLDGVIVYARSRLFPGYRVTKAIGDSMRETFIEQQYGWLLKGIRSKTTVIDIGAFIGDSAIYLAMNERVSSVEAYEPFPYTFELAMRNVSKSGLAHKISLRNQGISDKKGSMRLPQAPQGMTPSIRNNLVGKTVKITELKDILKGKANVIIKCDCEGEEHKIFRDGLDLSNVYKIQMEYHNGTGSLIRFLKGRGFVVSKRILNANGITSGEVGFIYAERVSRRS